MMPKRTLTQKALDQLAQSQRKELKRQKKKEPDIKDSLNLPLLPALPKEMDLDWTIGLDKKVQKARLDCLMFFYTQQLGWGPAVKKGTGWYTPDPPVRKMRALGYPKECRIKFAQKRVRSAAPEEARLYKELILEHREAHRRWRAARCEESWRWYLHGDNKPGKRNWNALAYVSYLKEVFSEPGYLWKTKYFKYTYRDILSRRQERKRAAKEMRDIGKRLSVVRDMIFEKMGVPKQYRRLV